MIANKIFTLLLVSAILYIPPMILLAQVDVSVEFSFGFSVVDSSTYTPRAEDIVVHEATSGNPHGHIAMYNEEQWISDFRQIDMFGGSEYRNNPNYTILRWNP